MKRFGLAVGLAAMMALAVPSLASAHGDYRSDRDWVLGGIHRTFLDGSGSVKFAIGAFETRTGADGLFYADYDDRFYGKTSYVARVTCLNVVGRNGMVGIKILKSNRPDAVVGKGRFIRVSAYSSSDPQKDSISPGADTDTGPTVCATPFAVATPTLSGKVLVHDGDA